MARNVASIPDINSSEDLFLDERSSMTTNGNNPIQPSEFDHLVHRYATWRRLNPSAPREDAAGHIVSDVLLNAAAEPPIGRILAVAACSISGVIPLILWK